jgi:hypothetical protein
LAHPWPEVLLWEAPTPSPPTSFCTHFHHQSFWPKESLSSSKLHEHKIHKSFKGWELLPQQEELQHGDSRSVKARGVSSWWQ